MKKTSLLLVAALTLTGCATPGKFTDKMNGFIGQNELALVSHYGPPQSVYTTTDGSRVLTYSRGSVMAMPSNTTYQPVRSSGTGTVTMQQGLRQTSGSYTTQSTTMVPVTTPGVTVTLQCTVHFTLNPQGVVQSWRAEGNHCVSNG